MTESVRFEDDSGIHAIRQAASASTGCADGEVVVWELVDLTSRGTVWPSLQLSGRALKASLRRTLVLGQYHTISYDIRYDSIN